MDGFMNNHYALALLYERNEYDFFDEKKLQYEKNIWCCELSDLSDISQIRKLKQSRGLRFLVLAEFRDAIVIEIIEKQLCGGRAVGFKLKFNKNNNLVASNLIFTVFFVSATFNDHLIDSLRGNAPIAITQSVEYTVGDKISVTLNMAYMKSYESIEIPLQVECDDIFVEI